MVDNPPTSTETTIGVVELEYSVLNFQLSGIFFRCILWRRSLSVWQRQKVRGIDVMTVCVSVQQERAEHLSCHCCALRKHDHGNPRLTNTYKRTPLHRKKKRKHDHPSINEETEHRKRESSVSNSPRPRAWRPLTIEQRDRYHI